MVLDDFDIIDDHKTVEEFFANQRKALNSLMKSIIDSQPQSGETGSDKPIEKKGGDTGDKNKEENNDEEEEKIISSVKRFESDIENHTGAWAKNNNPTGITRPLSKSLSAALESEGISFEKGSPRPRAEGGNYVRFETMGDGLQAYWIALSRGDSPIANRLSSWVGGSTAHRQDYIKKVLSTAFGSNWQQFKTKRFSELTEDERDSFLMAQVRNESGNLWKLLKQHDLSVADVINVKDKTLDDPILEPLYIPSQRGLTIPTQEAIVEAPTIKIPKTENPAV